MSMSRRSPALLAALAVCFPLFAACGDDAADVGEVVASADTAAADTTPAAPDAEPDDGLADASATDTERAADVEPVPPDGYCEAVVDAYCGFYMRCERMAVPDLATCLTTFAEVCDAVYEPYYVALADRGLLSLSAPDVAACAAYLEDVPCALQPGDLDGPCAGMWRGLAPVGAACSYGIESLVCDDATTCVLGLDFCGTCVAAADVGEACGDQVRCHAAASCVGGTCVARARPTEPCGEAAPCVVGASCVDGVCVGPAVVGLGDGCDQSRRCPYKSACVGGVCVATVLLGEACSASAPCASGACQDGTCVAAPPTFTGCLD